MFIAKTHQGECFSVADYHNKDSLRNIRKKESFYCPECKEEVILKIGMKKMPHFAHKKGTACLEGYERESEYHLTGKLKLYEWLQNQGLAPVLEQYHHAIAQRPDISFVHEGIHYVIEYQCSIIPEELFIKRTRNYFKANITPIWIIAGKNIRRQGARRAKLSRFDYLFLRNGRFNQWILPAYCPKTNNLIILNEIIPITIQKIITPFTITSLSNAKLSDLISPPVSLFNPLREWQTEIRKWKNTVSLYSTPQDKLLKQLYSHSLIPNLLPPYIGLPVPSAPYIETPPVQWQSYLFIDVLMKQEKISLNEILSSFRRRIRNQDILLRSVLSAQHQNIELAVKEYIELLVKLNFLKKITNNHYIRVLPNGIAENQLELEKIESEFYQKFGDIIMKSLRKKLME